MTINITLPEAGPNLRPTITVAGVGGAGGNAVNNMMHSNLEGVDFLIANTDAQALESSLCERKIQLGLKSTRGLGAGMRPDIGRQAAEESIEEIKEKLNGSNMVFIAAGMGGGTGTGAAPVIAQLAREIGVLTIAVVTKPFHFEGTQRMKLAQKGIEELQQQVDTLIIIPNQNLFKIANEKTTLSDAFKMADDILYAGVRGVTDLMVQPGLINLDFSDIKTVMSEMGKAMMGIGEAEGEGRSIRAAELAIANPLIDDVSLKGARGLIINITGGKDITLYEVDEAANRIKQEVRDEANIIYGTTCDERLSGVLRVSIVATGIDEHRTAISKNIEASTIAKQPSVSASLFIDNSVYNQKNNHNIDNSASPLNSDLNNDENYSSNDVSENDNKNINLLDEKYMDQNEDNSKNLNYESSFSDIDDNKSELTDENSFSETDENSDNLNDDNNLNEENEVSLEDEGENESKPAARRLSLFDSLSDSSDSSVNNEKIEEANEPVLHSEESFEEEAIEENVHNESYKTDAALSDEDYSQDKEEELLDIPTFLRRQAN